MRGLFSYSSFLSLGNCRFVVLIQESNLIYPSHVHAYDPRCIQVNHPHPNVLEFQAGGCIFYPLEQVNQCLTSSENHVHMLVKIGTCLAYWMIALSYTVNYLT